MPVRRAPLALLSGVLGLLLAIGACTADPEPVDPAPTVPTEQPAAAPPTGYDIGIVLPPDADLDPAVRRSITARLESVADQHDEQIRRLRTFSVDGGEFVGDVAAWLADRRTDLVCVLGDRAESAVVTLAGLYRDVDFCALPVGNVRDPLDEVVEVDDRTTRVELRSEELGYLVGVSARAQAGTAPVGLVLTGGELPGDRFREGLLAGLAGSRVIEAVAGPDVEAQPGADTGADTELTATQRAEAVVAAGAGAIVFSGGDGSAEAVEAVHHRVAVFAPLSLTGPARESVLDLGWEIRWDVAMAGPITVLAGDGAATSSSLGFRERVFEVVPGPPAGAALDAVVAEVLAGLMAGDLDPLSPAPGEGSSGSVPQVHTVEVPGAAAAPQPMPAPGSDPGSDPGSGEETDADPGGDADDSRVEPTTS